MFDASWQSRKMNSRFFKEMLLSCGFNQTTAARYFGLSLRTVRRMAAGTAKVPGAVALLLHLMRKHNEDPDIPPAKKRRRSR
jgi:DNA-binding transcriptional regulator YiaG